MCGRDPDPNKIIRIRITAKVNIMLANGWFLGGGGEPAYREGVPWAGAARGAGGAAGRPAAQDGGASPAEGRQEPAREDASRGD